jgi:transcriptional regulator with XRE-family HTH domain
MDEDSRQEQEEVARAIKLIEGVMRVQGVTKKILDERLGKSPGYFAQVLSGRLELKYRHILAILRGLDLEPRVFFRSLFPEPGEPVSGARMLERLFAELQRSGYGTYLSPPPSLSPLSPPAVPAFAPSPAASLPAIDADELDRRIQAAVAAALAARDARGEHEGQRVEAVEAGSTR